MQTKAVNFSSCTSFRSLNAPDYESLLLNQVFRVLEKVYFNIVCRRLRRGQSYPDSQTHCYWSGHTASPSCRLPFQPGSGRSDFWYNPTPTLEATNWKLFLPSYFSGLSGSLYLVECVLTALHDEQVRNWNQCLCYDVLSSLRRQRAIFDLVKDI